MMKRSAYRFVTVLLATLVMIVPLAACHTETQETEAESEMVYERPPKTTADPAAETATPVPGETGNPAEPSQGSTVTPVPGETGNPAEPSQGSAATQPAGNDPVSPGESSSSSDITAAKAAADRLAAEAGLAPLSADVTMLPVGARGNGGIRVSHKGGVTVFQYSENGHTVEYTVDTNRERTKQGMIEVLTSIDRGTQTLAVTNAGTSYLTKEGKKLAPKKFGESASVQLNERFNAENGHLYLEYTDTYEEVTTKKSYDFFLEGRTLVVQIISADVNGKGGYCAVYTGGSEGLTDPRVVSVVYAEEVSATIVEQGNETAYFVSAYLDKAKTFSTRMANVPGSSKQATVHGMTANYELNSAGRTNPIHELFYITASTDLMDCVGLNNAVKSPYRDSLNSWVVYDTWLYTNTYSARMYSDVHLAETYNMKDMLVVEHRWQRDTLDISNPAHFPASTHWGTASEFQNYITTLKEKLGWRLALHEDYWFMQPSDTNQYWNVPNVEQYLAQDAEGVLRYGWQQTSYANKSDMMKYYSGIESPQIHEAYGTDAAFLDVNGGVDPSTMNQVTLNADSATSRTLAQVVADNVTLFQSMKEIYQGPIITEGAQGIRSAFSLYAGYVDSISREITDNSNCRIMPDYELIYIRNLMANQGMGPPARFQTDTTSEDYNFDRYNATALAYGHTGFIGETHMASPLYEDEIVNAYYTFRAVQEEYLNTDNEVREIFYYTPDNKRLTLNQAVLADYDFTKTRLYVRYRNGLEICVNFSSEDWKAVAGGKQYVLDRYGYCAVNPETGLEMFSCLVNGVRVDYCSCADYLYANPRGNLVDFGNGIVANRMTIQCADGFEMNVATPVMTPPIHFTDLDTKTNGDNGLTYYYTADGVTLTPFTERSTEYDGWVHGEDGVLIYPVIVKTDNYGVAGVSEKEYVVIGYRLPDTGAIDLYTWTVLQGPKGEHGYEVRVALGSPENVVKSFRLEGDTQKAEAHTWSLTVTAGQELFLIYEPLVKKDKEWFGFSTTITYTFLGSGSGETDPADIKVEEDDEFRFTALADKNNGDNGLYFYYTSDGVELTPFTEYSASEGKWYHEGNGVLVYPALNPAANYAVAGTSAREYVAVGYRIPAGGKVELYSWTALQGANGEHGYRVKIALGTPDQIVASYENIGNTQNIVSQTYELTVKKGEMLYLIYEPVVKKNNEWFGYITKLTYLEVEGSSAAEKPVFAGDEFLFTELAGKRNGANGLTFYWTEDGKTLHAYRDYDPNEGRWYDNTEGQLNWIDPREIPADNYGMGQTSSKRYTAMSYRLPSDGAVDVFAWTALQGDHGDHGYHVKLALGTPENIVGSYDIVGDTQTVMAETFSLKVKKDDLLYILYEPVSFRDGELFGYINAVTYTYVGDPSEYIDDTEWDIQVKAGDTFRFTELATDRNGAHGLTYYYTEDGVTLKKITNRVAREDRWFQGSGGLLIYPRMNVSDNYAVAGTSSDLILVLGTRMPSSGTVDYYTRTVLQGSSSIHSYTVKVAQGTPDNIVAQYEVKGYPQTTEELHVQLKVTKGEEIFLIYDPGVKVDGEWFGFNNQYTYLSVEP